MFGQAMVLEKLRLSIDDQRNPSLERRITGDFQRISLEKRWHSLFGVSAGAYSDRLRAYSDKGQGATVEQARPAFALGHTPPVERIYASHSILHAYPRCRIDSYDAYAITNVFVDSGDDVRVFAFIAWSNGSQHKRGATVCRERYRSTMGRRHFDFSRCVTLGDVHAYSS
jgi:hypothetical protein